MPSPNRSPAWQALAAHHQAAEAVHLRDLLKDPERTKSLSFELDGLFLDLSKNRITDETLALLLNLASDQGLSEHIAAMAAGEKINSTEGRAALHMALRAEAADGFETGGKAVHDDVACVLGRMEDFVSSVENGEISGASGKTFTDVVNIGIGGSDQGPRLACRALAPFRRRALKAHFVSNVDATDLSDVLHACDPESTLFIVSSKTFTTQETMTNAMTARRWLTEALGSDAVSRHFVAVSTNRDAARDFGVADGNLFEIWDWVGGRFSVWSAIGLPIALMIGMKAFRAFLAGARVMDRHFLEAPAAENLPVLLALIGIWNRNFEGAGAHAVLPYDQTLDDLPGYLQQLEMESNGKSVTLDNAPVGSATAPVIFGQAGTNGQHAFYQLLHQGTDLISADFIGVVESANPAGDHQDKLLANFLAQSAALAIGREEDPETPPYKAFAGNRPSTSILLDRLDPQRLGMLLALYEHKVFVQGAIWNVNSFDQFGVELGKELAGPLVAALSRGGDAGAIDTSTAGLLARIQKLRTGGGPS